MNETDQKIRKQVYDLNIQDLEDFSVWEYCLDEEGVDVQDEATVRPYLKNVSISSSTVPDTLIIKANFIYANGEKAKGFVSVPLFSEKELGTLQPTIITKSGQVSFWHGVIEPEKADLSKYYELLGLNSTEIFPLAFETVVDVAGHKISGTISGFMVLEGINSENVKILH